MDDQGQGEPFPSTCIFTGAEPCSHLGAAAASRSGRFKSWTYASVQRPLSVHCLCRPQVCTVPHDRSQRFRDVQRNRRTTPTRASVRLILVRAVAGIQLWGAQRVCSRLVTRARKACPARAGRRCTPDAARGSAPTRETALATHAARCKPEDHRLPRRLSARGPWRVARRAATSSDWH